MQGPNPKGTPNLILHKDGHKYRVRSELLIFKDDKMLISKIDNKINQYGCRYKLPGGGVDDVNEYIEEAAAREAEEEVRIRTTNVRYTGKYYDGLYDIVPEWHKHTLHLDGIEYDGYISFICTAEYAGKYNGYIKKMDRDDTIKTAKFYSYDEVKSILRPVHKKIFEEYLLNKNILKFNEWMNENIRYGKLVNGKAVLNPDDYDDYVTISPDALYQNKVGVCWDYVEYEAKIFKEKFHMKQTCDEPKHMEFALYYMQHSDKDKDMPTHTWLVYNINGTFNIFESSWYANRGIHVFSSEDEMISYYLNKQESFYKEKKNPLHSPVIIRYNPRKKYGLSPEEYMKSVWNDGTRIKINRVNISHESYTSVTEAWNTTEMYHGSDLKLDVIKPTAYNRGNRLKKESWSVFMWPTYDLAYKWAIFIAIRNIIRGYEKQGLAHTPRGMHVSIGFNKYDFKVFAVEEDIPFIVEKMTGVKAYVYTLDCPIDTNFGFGNNNAQPEYSYDGELKPKKRKEITLTKNLLLDFIEPVSLEEYETRTKNAFEKNIRGPLGLIFYPGWDVIKRWKYVYCRLGTGEINPGDDLSEVMKNFNDEEYQRARKAFRLMKYGHESYTSHFVTEGILPKLVFYHGSGTEIKGNTIKADSMMLGNKIEAPSYAVFMWRKKENAYPWALYNLIRRICEKTNPDMFKKVRLDLFKTPIKINIEESVYDTLLNATLGKKCYVYGCSANITDLGLGHSAYLDEVVSKKDVRIVKREVITVTNKFFTDNTSVKTLEWFLDPANKNKYRSKYAGLLTRGLPNLLMYGDDTVFSLRSRIKDKIKEGKYKHGDDLNIIIADINKELNESYNGGGIMKHTHFVTEGFFDRFKTKHSDGDLIKENDRLLKGIKYGNDSHWSTHAKPVSDKLYNMSPDKTEPSDRKAIIPIAIKILKERLKRIKNTNFHKAIKPCKYEQDELRDWINKGEPLPIATWDMWKFTPKARTDDNADIYFNALMNNYLNDCNIRLGNRSFKLINQGDWDDGYISISDRNFVDESTVPEINHFVTESGGGTYDYPLTAKNKEKFMHELPSIAKAEIGRGYRGLVHCKLDQPVAHPIAFVNISITDGTVQASHGNPSVIGRLTAKLKKDISPNKKAVKENASHFVMVNEEENRPLINPYNKHGNIKITRRATHKKPIKHPSLIKKYVNSYENYTDFF